MMMMMILYGQEVKTNTMLILNKKVEETGLRKRLRKLDNSSLIDADDSDKLYSVWSGTDEEKTLWTGDDDDDIPTDPHPNEASDKYSDKLFEFEEKPKYRTISELTEHAVLQGYADSHERSKLQIHA
uniref:Uncharacterized protein n=1 Tax=Brassica oleracea TaxID=3712 RepID=A0A3P6EDW6_BRAOL|nr:unnamed protein product [Brassica oleracea]